MGPHNDPCALPCGLNLVRAPDHPERVVEVVDAKQVELTLLVDELGEVEAVACECGHGLVTVRVEGFEPVLAAV